MEPEPFDLTRNLNRWCRCIGVDVEALTAALAGGGGVSYADVLRDQPHLFSSSPVFLAREHLTRMQAVVTAVEEVVGLASYREKILARAPSIARVADATAGSFLGFDFHIGAGGPRLIEINTNAGGALLNAALAKAQRACCAEVEALVAAPAGGDVEAELVRMLRREWSLARGDRPLGRVAIVDENPASQYLYPEFRMFRELLASHGIDAEIVDSAAPLWDGESLRADGREIEMVYDRLTDFYFEADAHRGLRDAYAAGAVVVTPSPRAHALYADKRNLTLLCDGEELASLGVGRAAIDTLVAAVPRTLEVTAQQRDALWKERRGYFFKPARGYGSKAAYRGEKMTRTVWEKTVGEDYVAQALVPPSERTIAIDGEERPLKLDVRCYAYAGKVQLVAARLYQGQTTNFRTAGGGFAPVFTEAATAS